MPRARLPLLPVAGLAAAALVAPVAGAARGVRRSIAAGHVPRDYSWSPQFRDGRFVNRLPMTPTAPGDRSSMARDMAVGRSRRKPAAEVPLVTPALPAEAAELAATWLGHATVLLEVGDHWVLADPVWSERVSPSATLGPRRFHDVPLALADLPALSAVLISHDHYDHLDMATIETLARRQEAPFVVPLGVGEHLRSWGVAEDRIVELDWEQSHDLDGLRLTCTEARHFSGRGLVNNTTLWSSWVVESGGRRVYFGGDSGWSPAYAEIGRDHGPFDLTVLPIGAYDARWRDVHLDPDEAVRAHRELRGDLLLPIHWATFNLAFHDWAEPAEWLVRAAAEAGVRTTTPRPGERFAAGDDPPADTWWR